MGDNGKAGSWFKTHWYWLLAIAAGIVIGVLYIWPMISGFIGNLFSGLGSSSQTVATPAVPSAGTVSGSGTGQTGAVTPGNSQAVDTLTTELQKLQTELSLTSQNEKALQQSLTQQISTLTNQIGTLAKQQTSPTTTTGTTPTTTSVTRTNPTPVTKKVGKQLTHLQQQVTHTVKTVTLGVGNLRFTPPPSGPTYIGVHTGPKKPTMHVKSHTPKLMRKVVTHTTPEPVSHSHPSVVRKPVVRRGVGKIMRIS